MQNKTLTKKEKQNRLSQGKVSDSVASHVKFQGQVILLEVPTKQAPNHKTKPLDPELDQERSPLDEEPSGLYRFMPEPSLPKKEVLRC